MLFLGQVQYLYIYAGVLMTVESDCLSFKIFIKTSTVMRSGEP